MASSTKVSLKLLVDTKTERVLFVEASKEFIDFLFNLLHIPIGTVIRLLTKNGMVGCLGKLYESIENLIDTYLLHPNQDRNVLLKPSSNTAISSLLLPSNDDDSGKNDYETSNLYMCKNRCNYNVTHVLNTVCPNCQRSMNTAVPYVGKKATKVTQSSGEDGYVKGVVTYMVMDDLVVQPMSTISSITLLNKFNVKEVDALQEKIVELGTAESIKLLKVSLQCKNVLTSIFLKSREHKEASTCIRKLLGVET